MSLDRDPDRQGYWTDRGDPDIRCRPGVAPVPRSQARAASSSSGSPCFCAFRSGDGETSRRGARDARPSKGRRGSRQLRIICAASASGASITSIIWSAKNFRSLRVIAAVSATAKCGPFERFMIWRA